MTANPQIKQTVGKVVRGNSYFHVSSGPYVSVSWRNGMSQASKLVGITSKKDFNVVKIGVCKTTVSLLDYTDFFDDPFPSLQMAFTVDLQTNTFRVRSYDRGKNPPILHKKEFMLSLDHPSRGLFAALTRSLDNRGIKPNRPGFGFKRQWDRHLADLGIKILDHMVVDASNDYH